MYTPDHDVIKQLAKLYSRKNKEMHKGTDTCNGAHKRFPNGITNGADWYVVEGGMQDFNYFMSNAIELTIEVSCCKHIPESQLSLEWKKVRKVETEYTC